MIFAGLLPWWSQILEIQKKVKKEGKKTSSTCFQDE